MACTISKGRKVPCKDKVGGLYKVWFVNFGTQTLSIDPVSLQITGITGANGATGTTLFEYELKGTSNLSQEMTSDVSAGVTSVTQTLTLDLQGGDAQTNEEIKLLAWGRPHIYVQDNYGTVWLVGKFRGADLTSAVLQTGSAINEKYGYTVTMVATENTFADEVYGAGANGIGLLTDPFGGLTAGVDGVAGNIVVGS